MSTRVPVFFNEIQLEFKPLYEWAFGEKITHPETTARAENILQALSGADADFEIRKPREIPLDPLRRVHNYKLLTLYNTARALPPEETFYPSVFPRGTRRMADPTNIHHAGGFCMDSGTPLNAQTWAAATWSAACARDAAMALKKHALPLTYALSRPPGHHATRDEFGGYSYFNNVAIAAAYLRRFGRVAIVDIDFHHGNGTQGIFWRDDKVLVINLHGDPREFYPYFTGFAAETGAGKGDGFNINIPLPRGTDGRHYLRALQRHALPAVRHYDPAFLVISAGFDTYKKDPMGGFALDTDDFHAMGELLGRLRKPTVVVQEGGYYTPALGKNVRTFLYGVRDGAQ